MCCWPSHCTDTLSLNLAQAVRSWETIGARELNVLNTGPNATFSGAPNHMNQLLFISVDENGKARQGKAGKGKKRNEKRGKKETQDKLCSNGGAEASFRNTCHISCMPKELWAPQYLFKLACKHQAQREIKTDLECSQIRGFDSEVGMAMVLGESIFPLH